LSLQDAVAFELRQWLDKRLTCQPFNIGLDPQLRRLNPREFQCRQSLYTYAANDCDAILRIIIHSNIINDQYSEVAPVDKFNDGILFNEINNERGGNEISNEVNDEIILDEKVQPMIIGESVAIINSTNKPVTISTIIYNEPPLLEPISSDDEEPMDAAPKQKRSDKPTERDELEPGQPNYDQPTQTQVVQVNPNSQPTINTKQVDPPATRVKYKNPLSEAERKKIHNRSRTKHQRTRAYTREIILYNIEKRFPVKMMKQMLKERDILITQVNPVESRRTGQIILYVGIKESIKRKKYEELTELFTYENYRRLFPHKFKHENNQHRRVYRPPRANEYVQRKYR